MAEFNYRGTSRGHVKRNPDAGQRGEPAPLVCVELWFANFADPASFEDAKRARVFTMRAVWEGGTFDTVILSAHDDRAAKAEALASLVGLNVWCGYDNGVNVERLPSGAARQLPPEGHWEDEREPARHRDADFGTLICRWVLNRQENA